MPAHSLAHPVRHRFSALMGAVALLAGLLPAALVAPARVSAAPAELFFSEYIEGSSNNKALEIYNGTGAAVDLAAGGYNVQMYFNGNAAAGLTINLSGTVANGDVFVLAQSSADAAILAQADQTNGSGWFNGDDAVVLRKGMTVLDVIGQVGFDPGSEWGSGLQSTADNTLRRKSTIEAGDTDGMDAFDPSVEWDGYATNTFDGLGSHTLGSGPASPVINEFSASTAGADVEYLEVYGAPTTDLSSLSVLQLEGDSSSNQGTVDSVTAIGTTDASGFYLADLASNTLENGTITLLLVSGFSATAGTDLDTNDDGTLDSTPWTAVVDAVAVNDGGAGDLTYGVPVLGPNYDGVSGFAPGGASRIPDGYDSDAASDWVRNDFDLAGITGFTGTASAGEAYNTPGAMNEVYVPPITGECGDPATRIHDIQGSGADSPLVGQQVYVEAIVVGDFQTGAPGEDGNLGGFYLQEADANADADASTSEGIFVFAPGADDVSTGDRVRVVATVGEYTGSGSHQTELSGVGGVLVCAMGQALPTVTPVSLPVSSLSDFEAYEGMLVTFPQALTISEFFNFDRFNEIVLTDGRQFQPTAVADPGSAAAAVAEANALGRITLDDGRSTQNSDPAIHPNGDPFTLDNRFRAGDTVTDVTGVIDDTFGVYRIQPTQGATYTEVNPRPAAPEDVGGSLHVASFNVLNYFTTIDDGVHDICGPLADQECRGADNATELLRQRTKIVSAISAIDADVVGLMEIENNVTDGPTADLVAGLNDATAPGTYAYVATGAIGSDAIRVALIYKPASVTPLGSYAILDHMVDGRFDDTKSRPVLAQSFVENASGAVFTVAMNHLKSKGSDCGGAPDDDPQQGNCNGTRTLAAQALVDWLAGDPTGSGDLDALIMGDLNSYDHEDPITAIRSGADDTMGTGDDFSDLIKTYQGEDAYSYLFDGQLGYLDSALASPTIQSQVTGATIWHINADEPDILDYDTSFKELAQQALWEPNPYRSSDHDPVIVGLDLAAYDFGGFLAPIGNPGTVNAKAGKTIPVKFSLGGDRGLDVLFGTPQVFGCGDWPLGTSADAEHPGHSMLSYDASADEYTFGWKTKKAWAGSCKTLVVTFADGSYAMVSVDFR